MQRAGGRRAAERDVDERLREHRGERDGVGRGAEPVRDAVERRVRAAPREAPVRERLLDDRPDARVVRARERAAGRALVEVPRHLSGVEQVERERALERLLLRRPARRQPDRHAAVAQRGELSEHLVVLEHAAVGRGGVDLVHREAVAEVRARLLELAAERLGVVVLDLGRVGRDLPVRRVDVAPLRPDDDVVGVPVAQPRAEELLAAAVRPRRVEVAHAGGVRGVEDLERPGAQRLDRAVRAEVCVVADVQVAGAAERGEPEADAVWPALAGAGGKRGPRRHGVDCRRSAVEHARPAMEHMEAVIISLLVAVAFLSALATRIGVPYPILLVIGGLGLGFVPRIPDVRLEPDLVLVVFLPPLLYSAAFFANLRELKADLRTITLNSTLLVIATAAAVAVCAHALVEDLPWAVCFALGAIVAPTDPLAATAILRRYAVPRRMVNVLEGESLINDASALVLYRIAVVAIAGGAFSLLHASLEFVGAAAGGVAIGLVVAIALREIRRRLDDPPVEITISLLSGYAAYVPADAIGASGVVAAVTCGVALGWWAPEITTPNVRQELFSLWSSLTFLLNAILFVLVGLQLPAILDALSGESPGFLLGTAAVISAVVIGTRFAWGWTMPYVVRALDRRPSQRDRRVGWQLRMISSWSGMRGAVSLAAALALPASTPQRDLVIFLTFAVILVTVVLQGLTLPALIRALGIHDDGAEANEEPRARLAATQAALVRLEELGGEEWTRDDTVERMTGLYDCRRRRLKARAGKIDDDGYEDRSTAYQRLIREVLDAQRRAIVALRNEGTISNDVMHRIERELDLEDQRLEI